MLVARHSRSHILDLVISRASDQLNCVIRRRQAKAIGDHHSVNCVVMPPRPSAVPTRVQGRNFKQVDLDQFQRDIDRQCAELAQSEEKRLSELSEAYYHVCEAVLEKHAPLKIAVRNSQPKPWYNDHVDQMRAERRHFEHLWRRTKLGINRQLYVNARNAVTSCVAKSKIQFYCDNLEKADFKSMFRLVRSLCGQQKVIYPEFPAKQGTAISSLPTLLKRCKTFVTV